MRLLLRFLFSAVGLLLASAIVPGIGHKGFMNLVAVAVLLGALNATLGMMLRFIAFIPMACSFGCLSLFINGLVFWFTGWLSAKLDLGFSVSGFWAGFFGALVTSITATILESVFLGREQPRRPEPPRPIKIINE